MQKSVDIRRNDQVRVITGRDKGKQGRVLRVMPDESKVLVEHVMMVKKNVRPNPQKQHQGRHRRAGKPDFHQQRDADVRVLQPAGPRGPRETRRPPGARVQALRNDAGEMSAVRGVRDSSAYPERGRKAESKDQTN